MNNQKLNIFKDSGNWKYILIIVILTFLVSGGILGYQWWVGKKEIKLPVVEKKEEILKVSVSNCENIALEKEIERTLCFINLGKESKDINLCNQIKDIREAGYCYGGVAGAKKDATVCLKFQKITEGWYKKGQETNTPAELSWILYRNIPLELESSEFSVLNFNLPIRGHGTELAWEMGVLFGTPCYIGAAVVQEDPEICNWWDEGISPGRNFCHIQASVLLAAIKKDSKICNEILKNFESDESYFTPLCYGVVGFETKNTNLCDKINDDKIKAFCFSYIARTLKDPEICEKISFESSLIWKDYCFFEVTRTLPELNVCNRIKSYQVRDDCYILLAGVLYDEKICEKRSQLLIEKDTKCEEHFKSRLELVKDSSICENLNNEENKELCYFYSAVNSKNIEICKKIIDSQRQEGCYFKLAKILEDEMLCEKIKSIETKSDCYFNFVDFWTYEPELSPENLIKFSKERAINLCNNIKDEEKKEICWHAVAEYLKDLSFCDKLKEQDNLPNKNWCYYEVIVLRELDLKNPAVCQNMTEDKDICYRKVAENLGDVNICNNLDGSKRGYCQAGVAKVLKDKTICEKIEIQSPQESCYSSLAEILKDETICLKIKERRQKDQCYLGVAKTKKDRMLCEQIYSPGGCSIPNYKHDCYSILALDLKDSNLCEKIECEIERERCFNHLARNQKNINLCEKIHTESEKTKCKNYIETRIKLEEKGWKLGD